MPRIGERHEIRQLLTREAPGTEQGSGLPLLWVTSWSSCSPLTPAQLRGFIPGQMWGARAEAGHSREQVIFLVATALAWIPICGCTLASYQMPSGHVWVQTSVSPKVFHGGWLLIEAPLFQFHTGHFGAPPLLHCPLSESSPNPHS